MAYEQRPGDISIFAETDKTNERAPDWKGSMIVPDGVKPGDKLEVAFWAKGDRGTMLAGSVKPPRQREGVGGSDTGFRPAPTGDVAGSGRGPASAYDMSDDIPFARPAYHGEV
jgi:hypothetical protein